MISLNKADETVLLGLIDAHYFHSTVAFDEISERLRLTEFLSFIQSCEALNELHDLFLSHSNEFALQSYLNANRHEETTWRLWSRRHKSKAPSPGQQ